MISFEDLTPEQMEKARQCKNPSDLIELAKSEGIELTDGQLEAIAGGEDWRSCESFSPKRLY